MQPYVILNSAISLDGKIGEKGKQIIFSNRLDNYRVRTLRSSVDAVIIGIETILEDDPELVVKGPVRKEAIKVIVDRSAETPVDAKIFEGNAPMIIAVSQGAPKSRIEKLKVIRDNVEVIVAGGNTINLSKLLWILYERGSRKVLIEGGGAFSRRMLDEKFVNEIYLTVAPVLLGKGINFFASKTPEHVELSLEGILQYGDQVVLHYIVK